MTATDGTPPKLLRIRFEFRFADQVNRRTLQTVRAIMRELMPTQIGTQMQEVFVWAMRWQSEIMEYGHTTRGDFNHGPMIENGFEDDNGIELAVVRYSAV